MREQKTIEIEGADGKKYTYTVRQMQPMKALHTLTDIVKMIGPALAPVASNVGEFAKLLDKDVSELQTDFLGEAVKALTSGLDKNTIESVIKALAECTTIAWDTDTGRSDEVPLSKAFDRHFGDAGLGAMLKWVPFALQTQYDDFLAVVVNASKSVRPPKKATAQA